MVSTYASVGGMAGMEGQAPSALKLPSRAINRNAPYQRIAAEEAWSIRELVAAQLDLLRSACPPDDPALRMAAMFAQHAQLQHELCEVGAERLARMDELGIDRQLLLLTAPGVQVLERGVGTELAPLSNDRLADICRRHPDRFLRAACLCAAACTRCGRRDRARYDQAGAVRRRAQRAHAGPLSRRAAILADSRGARGA